MTTALRIVPGEYYWQSKVPTKIFQSNLTQLLYVGLYNNYTFRTKNYKIPCTLTNKLNESHSRNKRNKFYESYKRLV